MTLLTSLLYHLKCSLVPNDFWLCSLMSPLGLLCSNTAVPSSWSSYGLLKYNWCEKQLLASKLVYVKKDGYRQETPNKNDVWARSCSYHIWNVGGAKQRSWGGLIADQM
ncbi:predicted protein [Lichtheimia corymbifera JMRC:FSU:9682]|uniref:Uncharacterized protein n=1 Tax=Lichtheimia corymbifera JMRC:FSU:9682 TaxID=1263082 RepID=A0A068SAQ2_9FUNG|nr:predicted protein [Lichtheimia corymbifera JMRC:FSU:9682]